MVNNFFDEMQPCLMERLGKIYNSDGGYCESADREAEAFRRLEESFTESQLEMVKDYRSTIYASGGVCEMLAYRQGMRDLAAILGVGDKVQDEQGDRAVSSEA